MGYDNSDVFRGFLINNFISAQKGGLFFKDRLPAATTDEISRAAPYVAESFEDAAAIKKGLDAWLSSVRLNADSEAISQVFAKAVSECGMNKKNTCFVEMCWLMKYLSAKPQSLFYIGAAGLKELYFMYMMSLAGVHVTLVSYGLDKDFDSFVYKDKVTVYTGRISSPIQIDFGSLDISKEARLAEMRSAGERVGGKVKRLETTAAGMFEDILKDRKTRVIKNGGVYTEDGDIPVYCAALIGYNDEAVYTNMLVQFKEKFAGVKKQLIFIEKPLTNPTAEEAKSLGGISRNSTAEMIDSLALLIKLNGDADRTALAQNALRELLNTLNNGNQTVVLNYGNKIITWLYRCTQARKYAVQYDYGDISQSELYFLNFMSKCGFDVVYITPNRKMLDMTVDRNLENRMQIFQLPESKESGSYPDKPVKMKMATVAYSAERELDTMLYGGDAGVFRSFQFPNSQSLTLKTTYEEIGILWRQEAKFRTGFATSGNLVTIPNIFAKISGVTDGKAGEYWEEIRSRLTPDTILYVKKQGQAVNGELDLSVYRSFYRNGKIDTEKLRSSTLNKYGYLPDRLQDLLFYKIQETIDSGFLKLERDYLMCSVIHYGLSLDKEFLRLLQHFDFTRQIPKLVIIDAVEDTFTEEECIRIVLCNLMGFDVLVYTPTGYKNIETFIKSDAFEEHTMNEFMYNMEVPKFKIPSEERSGGFFGKLFGKH